MLTDAAARLEVTNQSHSQGAGYRIPTATPQNASDGEALAQVGYPYPVIPSRRFKSLQIRFIMGLLEG